MINEHRRIVSIFRNPYSGVYLQVEPQNGTGHCIVYLYIEGKRLHPNTEKPVRYTLNLTQFGSLERS